MLIQDGLADARLQFQVDNAQGAVAISDEQFAGLRIESQIVGITVKIMRFHLLKSCAVVGVDMSGLAVGNVEPVSFRPIEESLRLMKSSDTLNDPAGIYIDHLHGIVAKRGNENPFARRIDRQMIDASFHTGKRDRLLEPQRLRKHDAASAPNSGQDSEARTICRQSVVHSISGERLRDAAS